MKGKRCLPFTCPRCAIGVRKLQRSAMTAQEKGIFSRKRCAFRVIAAQRADRGVYMSGNDKPSEVQWERLLPAEFRALFAALPVVFLPLGTVEWHGEHNALGLDSIKA